MAYNRDRNSRDGGEYRPRPSFGDRPRFGGGRSERGSVEMHNAVCDNCGKDCQVPFRPTGGKPVFCSSCFENQRGSSDSRGSERRSFDRPSEYRPSNPSERPGNYTQQFEALNAKLNEILVLLKPNSNVEIAKEEIAISEEPEEQVVTVKIPKKAKK